MTSRDCIYWLQGFFELADPHSLSAEQIKTIRAHLNMVFVHEIDPAMGDKKHQEKLDEIHSQGKPEPPFHGYPTSPEGIRGLVLKC